MAPVGETVAVNVMSVPVVVDVLEAASVVVVAVPEELLPLELQPTAKKRAKRHPKRIGGQEDRRFIFLNLESWDIPDVSSRIGEA